MFLMKTRIYVGIILSTFSIAHAEVGNNPDATIENKSIQKKPITIVPEIGTTNFHVTGTDSGYRSASVVGASAKFFTNNERMKWSVGLQYLQAGFKLKEDYGFFTLNLADISMDYLTVPVKGEYMISDPAKQGVRYFAVGSLTPAYLLSAKYKNLIDSSEKEKGIRNDMNGLDTFAGIGFGGQQETTIGIFDFTLEYQKGLMNISKDGDLKSEGFIVKAGYNYVL